MSFTVIFGRTNKPENSTYRFATGLGESVDCVLRKGCDVLKPVIEIRKEWTYVQSTLLNCNVAFIADFQNRYYRVKNWQFNGPLTLAYLEVDVMASFKTELSSQSFYITRSTMASLCDPSIPDTSIPQPCGMYQALSFFRENPLQPPENDYGVFVVGVINNSATFGAVDYYVMSYLVFMSFTAALCNMSNMGDFTDVVDGVAKAIVNPFQYIVSARWYPYTTLDFTSRGLTGGGVSSIRCGYYNVSFSGTAYYFAAGVLNIEFTNVVTLTIHKNPLNDGKHDFLNYAPYARYIFNFYPFGSFEIDPALLYGFSNLYVWYSVDLRTGSAICKLGNSVRGTDYTDWRMPQAFKTIEGEIGVDIPMASIQSYIPSKSQGVVMGTITAVNSFGGFGQLLKRVWASASGALGKAVGMGEEELNEVYGLIGAEPISKQDLSNVTSAASQANTTAEIHGMQGAVSHYHTNQISLMGIFYGPRNYADTNPIFGYPSCRVVQLGNLSGYAICANARPSLYDATEPELTEVTRILNSGFVWE